MVWRWWGYWQANGDSKRPIALAGTLHVIMLDWLLTLPVWLGAFLDKVHALLGKLLQWLDDMGVHVRHL